MLVLSGRLKRTRILLDIIPVGCVQFLWSRVHVIRVFVHLLFDLLVFLIFEVIFDNLIHLVLIGEPSGYNVGGQNADDKCSVLLVILIQVLQDGDDVVLFKANLAVLNHRVT